MPASPRLCGLVISSPFGEEAFIVALNPTYTFLFQGHLIFSISVKFFYFGQLLLFRSGSSILVRFFYFGQAPRAPNIS